MDRLTASDYPTGFGFRPHVWPPHPTVCSGSSGRAQKGKRCPPLLVELRLRLVVELVAYSVIEGRSEGIVLARIDAVCEALEKFPEWIQGPVGRGGGSYSPTADDSFLPNRGRITPDRTAEYSIAAAGIRSTGVQVRTDGERGFDRHLAVEFLPEFPAEARPGRFSDLHAAARERPERRSVPPALLDEEDPTVHRSDQRLRTRTEDDIAIPSPFQRSGGSWSNSWRDCCVGSCEEGRGAGR